MQFYHPGKKCGNFCLVCKNIVVLLSCKGLYFIGIDSVVIEIDCIVLESSSYIFVSLINKYETLMLCSFLS